LRFDVFAGQPGGHQPDHRDFDHRFGVRGFALIVAGQPSAPSQPGESPFHHPPPGQHLEAFHIGVTRHDLQLDTGVLPRPAQQTLIDTVGIAGIGPDQPEQRKHRGDPGQDQFRPRPLLHRGGMHHRLEQEPTGIDEQVPLTASGAFTGIPADLVAALMAVRGLRVQHRSRWLPITSLSHPDQVTQPVMHPIPRAISTPATKPPVGGIPRRQVMRDMPPRSPGPQHVENCVEDQPSRVTQRAPAPARIPLREKGFQDFPLPVGQ
jgi:hypothetical protein